MQINISLIPLDTNIFARIYVVITWELLENVINATQGNNGNAAALGPPSPPPNNRQSAASQTRGATQREDREPAPAGVRVAVSGRSTSVSRGLAQARASRTCPHLSPARFRDARSAPAQLRRHRARAERALTPVRVSCLPSGCSPAGGRVSVLFRSDLDGRRRAGRGAGPQDKGRRWPGQGPPRGASLRAGGG